jgi:CheY-like chemotaxis protein
MAAVLVVDDDQMLRAATRDILQDEGYEVVEAQDGLAALHVLRQAEEPMVVLLDIVMPEVTGIDVLTLVGGDPRLQRHEYIIWAASRVKLPGELLDELGVPVMLKPFDLDDLLAQIAEATERLGRDATG